MTLPCRLLARLLLESYSMRILTKVRGRGSGVGAGSFLALSSARAIICETSSKSCWPEVLLTIDRRIILADSFHGYYTDVMGEGSWNGK